MSKHVLSVLLKHWLLALAMLAGCSAQAVGAGEALPPVSEVTRRMVERAGKVAEAGQEAQYTYEKRSFLEWLDADGQAVKSEEKVYAVTLIHGLPFNRLVKIQGHALSEEELKEEQAREEKFRKRFVSLDKKQIAEERKALITPELLERFEMKVQERVAVNGRPTLVVAFKPRTGELPAKTIEDRLLNRMAGTVWVDEAEADTARLEVHLVEPFSMGWFGWLGSLTRCELSLHRQRMPDGVWVNVKTVLSIQYRKLTTTTRFRSTEESRDFHQVQPMR